MMIHWKPSVTASGVHLAQCATAVGSHTKIHASLFAASQRLLRALHRLPTPETVSQRLLMQLAIVSDTVEEVVGRFPAEWSTCPEICDALHELFSAVFQQHAGLAEELAARVRPLREQWEARAPGYLKALSVGLGLPLANGGEPLTLALVQPVLGGYGAHCGDAKAVIEAVLYHPVPAVPEPVRLGWLVAEQCSQANQDMDLRSLLQVVHHAAQRVEWLSPNVQVADLVDAWGLG